MNSYTKTGAHNCFLFDDIVQNLRDFEPSKENVSKRLNMSFWILHFTA